MGLGVSAARREAVGIDVPTNIELLSYAFLCFSTRAISVMTMALSTALHMS